jgi:hypothetical protein
MADTKEHNRVKLSDLVLAGVDDHKREEEWSAAVDSWWNNSNLLKPYLNQVFPPAFRPLLVVDKQHEMFCISASPPMTTNYVPTPAGIQLHVIVNEPIRFVGVLYSDLRTKNGMTHIDSGIESLIYTEG